ncbi:hypothetical protein TWF281_000280 [Arthrobotrys megalospora]
MQLPNLLFTLLLTSTIPSALGYGYDPEPKGKQVTITKTNWQTKTQYKTVTKCTTKYITKTLTKTETETVEAGEITDSPEPEPDATTEDPMSTCPPSVVKYITKNCATVTGCPPGAVCDNVVETRRYLCNCIGAPARTSTFTKECEKECCGGNQFTYEMLGSPGCPTKTAAWSVIE